MQLLPNPELGLDVENIASGGSSGFNGAEVTAALSQKLELGGKRSKRTTIAALEAEALKAEIASDERNVRIADSAFTTLLEARQLRELSERNLVRARKLSTLDTLLEVGKSNRIDVGKAKLAISEARENLAEARSAESDAAAELAKRSMGRWRGQCHRLRIARRTGRFRPIRSGVRDLAPSGDACRRVAFRPCASHLRSRKSEAFLRCRGRWSSP